MKKFVVFLISILFFFSCGNQQDGKVKSKYITVYADLEDFEKDKSFLDVFKDYELIPLENVREAMLCDVRKLVVTPIYMYVYDNNGTPSISVFRENGAYDHHIGNYGMAKSEYVRIFDLDVNSNNQVLVLSLDAVKVYDGKDGSFLYSSNFDDDVRLQNILSVGDTSVLSSNHVGADYMICVYDKSFNLLRKMLRQTMDIPQDVSPIHNPLQMCNDTILYVDFYESSFYLWEKDNVSQICKYVLKSDNMITRDNWQEADIVKDQIENACYAQNKIIGSMVYQQISCYYFFDVEKETLDVYACSDFAPKIYCYYNGFYYALVSPETLQNIVKSDSRYSTEMQKVFKNLIDRTGCELNENGNYWVLKLKLNEKFRGQSSTN